jgi:hypothetical protein
MVTRDERRRRRRNAKARLKGLAVALWGAVDILPKGEDTASRYVGEKQAYNDLATFKVSRRTRI